MIYLYALIAILALYISYKTGKAKGFKIGTKDCDVICDDCEQAIFAKGFYTGVDATLADQEKERDEIVEKATKKVQRTVKKVAKKAKKDIKK